MERREFLTSTAAALGSTAMLLQAAAKLPASERIRVGCIGAAGRGGALVRTFSKSPQADVVAIADLDPGRLASGVDASQKIQGFKPKGVKDFRQLIDDNSLDAIVVGTPDHGDHFVSLELVRAHAEKHGPLALIHFDAHADTEPIADAVNHGNMFRTAMNDELIDPRHSIQIGSRTQYGDGNYPIRLLSAATANEWSARDVGPAGRPGGGESGGFGTPNWFSTKYGGGSVLPRS